MAHNRECRKVISFDLSTIRMKECRVELGLKPEGYTSTYDKITKYFESNGFEHVEGTGFVSYKPVSYYKVRKIIAGLGKEIPNCDADCLKHMIVSELNDNYFDYTKYGKNSLKKHTRVPQKKAAVKSVESASKPSIKDTMKTMQKKADEHNSKINSFRNELSNNKER